MHRILTCGFLFSAVIVSGVVRAQDQTAPAPATTAGFPSDYPMARPGVFIQGSAWSEVQNQFPAKTRAARGIAASFSYGLVPAKVVADYYGERSATQTDLSHPVLCICHIISLPGQPVIVRLHPKKDMRELDGGRMIVYPVVGGSKMADANKSDLVPVDVNQPDPQVWLVRPQVPLPPGEYALMLGTQNINIYPFSVEAAAGNSIAPH